MLEYYNSKVTFANILGADDNNRH